MHSQTSKSRSQQTAGDNATRTLKESAEREREKARVQGITSPRSSRSSVGIAGKHSLRLEGQIEVKGVWVLFPLFHCGGMQIDRDMCS
jgi:hypothetical protein